MKWNHVAFASYFDLDMYWVVVRMGGLAHSLARVKLRSPHIPVIVYATNVD